MKVVFMGTPEFAALCLEEILESKHEVVGIVTVPDKAAGRGQRITQSAVAKLALEKNIPLLQPKKLKDSDFVEELKALNADVFVVVAFRMLPKEVWEIPAKGTFNLHASLLPQYRGAAPINWAIINGETESGVTTFLIDEEIDTGNILLMEKVEIAPDHNAGDLHDNLVEVGKKLILKTLDGLNENSIHAKPQKEGGNLKPAPKIFKEDCKINWKESVEKIHNTIRGLSPYPAAWTSFKNEKEQKTFKIFKGYFTKEKDENSPLYSLSFDNNEFAIHLEDGTYYIEELQPEGKKRMMAKDFINGLQNKKGWTIGEIS